MGPTGFHTGWRAAACALLLSAACGGGSSPPPVPAEPPVAAGPGVPVGAASALKIIGPAGGSVTSSDGILTASIPAGALSVDIDVTIEIITNTAPSPVGNAYRIVAPDGTILAAPVALVFTPPLDAPPLAELTVATWTAQDATGASGFWVRQQSITRDATAGTLTVTTTTLGDWAIVGAPNGRDLIGVYHVESTVSVPVVADGKSALNFHAGDLTTGWYIQSGQLTAASPITPAGATCSPVAATMPLAPNVAELLASPERFRWAVNGQWDLTCSPPGTDFAYLSFDTVGIGYLSCARSYLETPLITPEKLLGRYVIDCGAAGTVTASWHFETCNAGEPCPSSNPCHTASITCDTWLPLCVDDGNVPNGLACDLVPGVNEVCGDGVCNVCRIGETCTPPGNVCHVGAYTCDTGFEVCTDTGAFVANGTACDVVAGADEVCGNGTCNLCTAGNACATNPNPCVAGTTSCATGFETCVDTSTPIAAGTVCDVNPLADEVCNGAGACIACSAGLSCSTNVNECVAGITSCATGGQTCENTATPIANGTACDDLPAVPEVCLDGVCNACTAGLLCATNPNACVQGVTSCATGQEICVDTTTPIPNGTACDVTPAVPEVCFNGVCSACSAGLSCSTNPNSCYTGTTSCATGLETCVDDLQLANGTICGTNLVCSAGTCSFCEAGLSCATNPDPCLTGITSCSTGSSACVDNAAAPEPNGTICGVNQVCSTGACVACTAGLACATNPNPCVDGATSCATGASVCIDTGTVKPNGTACDVTPSVEEVCNGGTCNACTAGLACASNPNACVEGVTSCASGTQQCVDTATPIAAGTSCGVNLVCTGTGACAACTAGLACSGNPNPCLAGVTSCATGAETCVDGPTPIPNGTVCDVIPAVPEVCLNGTCGACTADLSCTTNPDDLCHDGVTSCATGASVCVDGAAKADGTVCGTDRVCSAGACTSCTGGLSCATNPDPLCHDGVTSCATGTSACLDAAAKANGTSCGTDLVCNGGTCVSCAAGVACSTNPNPCYAGTTSCATGVQACVDGAVLPNGTSCGTDLVCNAGTCASCTAGVTCDTNPDPCLTGITSCATGTLACLDNPLAPEPDVTTTCPGGVCLLGVCNACTAGLACDTNPGSQCVYGVTSCATGVQTCVDATAKPNGTTCDVNLSVPEVCDGGACVACTSGLSCSTNPNPCVLGTTSCSTGTETCVDTATAKPNGTTCGSNQVCSAGTCSSCTAGLACATNPNAACTLGVTSCSTGVETCLDGAAKAAGTSCGTNLVCSTTATCVSCTEGLACDTNLDACLTGVTSCSTGAQTCVDNPLAPEPNGTVCGGGQVCNGGVCSTCVSGVSCVGNPSPCFAGVTSCATGTSQCVDSGTVLANGTACDVTAAPEVCNAGVCTACTSGALCDTNPDPCVTGITSCSTGTQTCLDNAAVPEPNGTLCGTNLVCSAGTCTSCTAGVACSTNPNPCVDGATSCATGAETCVDTATPKANGTVCDVNLAVPEVCNAGTCAACTSGAACSTNPNPCVLGTTSCATGTETCVDTATPITDGTICGTDQVCSAGTCTTCFSGLSCGTNPDPCLAGVTSCATGTQACVDGITPAANGTICGTNQVCNAGVCTACTAGVGCTTNPNPCVAGTTSCSTGTPTCLDTSTPIANGTSCGTDQVCNSGTCTACTAGVGCTTNPNPCRTGTTSCATGTSVCVDGAAVADGTTCDVNLSVAEVCSGGTCVACTAGEACTPANPCHVGTTACASGPTCTDTGANVADGTSCGAGLSCNLGACVQSRTVSGTRLASYWTAGAGCTAAAPCRSTVVAPDVLGLTAQVDALFPDGAGDWVRYPGTFSLDGSFTIPNVPTGAYRLVLSDGNGVAHVVDTSSSSVDLGYDVLGRGDAALATLPTAVTFQLSGLTNWLIDDEVQATAFDADVWDVPVSGTEIVTGQTTGDVVENWSASSVGRALNLLSSGDVLQVHQLATATVVVDTTAYAYQRATVSTALSGYTLTDGEAATLPAALTAVTSTGSIAVDWDPEQFEALLPQLGPSGTVAVADAHRVDVETAPYASLAAAPVGTFGSPQLFRIVRAEGGPTVTLARITLPATTYGRFLDPALASEWWRADYTALVSYTAPGATTSLSVPATVARRDRMTALPAPIVPAVGPVQSPLVQGQDALGAISTLGTTTPTIAWTAPATGMPTRYEVRIHRLGVGAGGATTSTPVAVFQLAGTSFKIPANLLSTGEPYYAEITAYAMASDRFDLAPLRLVQVFSNATTLTSPFTP